MAKVAFRVDASLQIGSGHLMRCLTLAEALRERGAKCRFICRSHPGHMLEQVWDRGFDLHVLPPGAPGLSAVEDGQEEQPAHAAWLGCDWRTDAEQTAQALGGQDPDWLVVDHYAIDAKWHAALAPHHGRLFVIDDLADRALGCGLLLDQTYGRQPADYRPLVPDDCELLCGSRYALLRPQFGAYRERSLARRALAHSGRPALSRLLVTMGGVDKNNVTGHVLETLRHAGLDPNSELTVVMGITAPWLDEVRTQAKTLPWPCRVLVNVGHMAALMADSDLCIGASGSTAWERCVLGLPTIMVTTAENQKNIARALHEAGAAHSVGCSDAPEFGERLLAALDYFTKDSTALPASSQAAARVCAGNGADLVSKKLLESVRP